eukprot:m.11205 g.11205  ORF g.11205 m.11205 type:complete len:467 (-) comp7602_c0_seq2:46-1446(-)
MALFVVAGQPDCLVFAEAEHFCKFLSLSLGAAFMVRKIAVPKPEWQAFSERTIQDQGWTTQQLQSPTFWRVLGEGNARGRLIGGLTEFRALIKEWYGIEQEAGEYKTPFQTGNIEEASKQWVTSQPQCDNLVRVLVTAATSSVSQFLLERLSRGDAFGLATAVHITMVDNSVQHSKLQDVATDFEEGNFPLLSGVQVTATIPDTIPAGFLFYVNDKEHLADAAADAHQFSTHINKDNTAFKIIVLGPHALTIAAVMVSSVPDLQQRVFVPCPLSGQVAAVLAHRVNEHIEQVDMKVLASNTRNIGVWVDDVVDISRAVFVDYGAVVGQKTETPVKAVVRNDVFWNSTFDKQLKDRARAFSPMQWTRSACVLAAAIHDCFQESICCGMFNDQAQIFSYQPTSFKDGKGSLQSIPSGAKFEEAVARVASKRDEAFHAVGLPIPKTIVQSDPETSPPVIDQTEEKEDTE